MPIIPANDNDLSHKVCEKYVALVTDASLKFACAATAGCHEIAVDVSCVYGSASSFSGPLEPLFVRDNSSPPHFPPAAAVADRISDVVSPRVPPLAHCSCFPLSGVSSRSPLGTFHCMLICIRDGACAWLGGSVWLSCATVLNWTCTQRGRRCKPTFSSAPASDMPCGTIRFVGSRQHLCTTRWDGGCLGKTADPKDVIKQQICGTSFDPGQK